MSQLVANIHYLMQKHGIENPTRLAKVSGVPQPTIKRILDGTSTDPRTDTLQSLADVFNVTVEYLRTGDPANKYAGIANLVKESAQSNYELPETKIAAENPRPGAPIALQLERNFFKALPPELHRNVERKMNFQGHAYRFDYCSEKLIAEIGAIFVRSVAGKTRTISTMGTTRSLWRMSAYRMLTKDAIPDRAYFLFLTVIDETEGPLPISTITRITGEAALHGIRVVVVGGVEDAAKLVEAIENGTLKDLTPMDYDEDDTF